MSLPQIKAIINTAFEKEIYLYIYAFIGFMKAETKSIYN